MQALIAAAHKWIQQPFTTQGSLLDWFLITGVVLVSAVLWSRVLAHIGE